jgi:hypothetical protein
LAACKHSGVKARMQREMMIMGEKFGTLGAFRKSAFPLSNSLSLATILKRGTGKSLWPWNAASKKSGKITRRTFCTLPSAFVQL